MAAFSVFSTSFTGELVLVRSSSKVGEIVFSGTMVKVGGSIGN